MIRKKLSFPIDSSFKRKLLYWAKQFEHVCILDSNLHVNEPRTKNQDTGTPTYELIAAIGCIEEITPTSDCFESLKNFLDTNKDWAFGHFSYDLKNEVELLNSENPDSIEFPPMCFFRPKYVFIVSNSIVDVLFINNITSTEEIKKIIGQISHFSNLKSQTSNLSIKSRITKEQYINSVKQLQHHIQLGDIYEVNFCQEFYSEHASINPIAVYEKLTAISQAPFSAYYKSADNYLLCASPERFIKNTNGKIISQPIKGTRKRGNTAEEDERLKKELSVDEKEKSENVMIVDLVRNDLSRTAKRGSVKVDELFGIYSFKQVHQLVSTVSSEKKDGIHPVDVIKHAFPMGSMTGAPKIRAMELIEEHESFRRGLFSGSVGYFDPQQNFDFNVVIRSIQYNSKKNYISFATGGAITAKAIAEQEYEECMVKAKAMFEVLESSY